MYHTHQSTAEENAHHRDLSQRMLAYGLIVSVIGLPIGIALKEPVLWGLALAGIAIGGVKLLSRNHTRE